MATNYKRGSLALARRVFNTPQLVIESDLQRISQYIVDRANGVELTVINNIHESEKEVSEKVELQTLRSMASYKNDEEKARYHARLGITNDGKRGNLSVEGTLVAKAGQIDADCMELTSYEKLFSMFQLQANEGIEELVLHVDSGGGEAYSVFEMAGEIQALAKEKNIKIIAFVDGLAASAAYAVSSIADEIVVRPDAEVGSIGVVVQLINNSKMLENIGITRKFVTYGDNKVPFDDKGEFTDKFINSLQKKVDKTGLEFTNFVAKNRDMKVEDVIATQAEVFDSEEALKLGLIDKIMTKSEFFNDYLPNLKSNSTNQYYLQQENNMTQENKNVSVEALQAQLDTTTQSLTNMTTEKETIQASFDTLTQANEKLSTEFNDLQAKYDALVTEQEEKAKQAKYDSRKAKLAEHLGSDNEQLDAIVTSLELMSDEQFEVLAGSYAVGVTKNAEAMDELGGEGEQSKTQANLQKEKELTLAEKIAAKAKLKAQ